jgi:hypothetical protein
MKLRAEVVIEARGVTEQAVVIDEYDDDGQGAEVVQAREAFSCDSGLQRKSV